MAALINRAVLKISATRSNVLLISSNHGKISAVANFSSQKSEVNAPSNNNEGQITKSVFISQSNDIFTNLAIEDWLYKNNDFNQHHVLFIWRNNPCVVIGRHQNPWLEANVDFLSNKGIDIARRNSGGGTVYHDRGNVNLTFFTPRGLYNRKNNLEVIQKAVARNFALDVDISSRDDLLLNNHFKVSGTASKLGRNTAYHHCTLLIDANKSNLSKCLQKTNDDISTNATRSVPSPIKNLREACQAMKPENFLEAVGWEYLRTCPLSRQDGGSHQISKQRGFQLINPTDKWFPGLAKIRDEYRSWDWRFGKTPKFTVSRTSSVMQDASLTLKVENGIIADLGFKMAASEGALARSEALSDVRGHRYTSSTLAFLERAMAEPEREAQALRA